jgi:hypothetical protein
MNPEQPFNLELDSDRRFFDLFYGRATAATQQMNNPSDEQLAESAASPVPTNETIDVRADDIMRFIVEGARQKIIDQYARGGFDDGPQSAA